MPESLGMSLVKTPSCREPGGASRQPSPAALPLRVSSQFPEMPSTVPRSPSSLPSSLHLLYGSRGPGLPVATPVPNLSPCLPCQGSSCRAEVSRGTLAVRHRARRRARPQRKAPLIHLRAEKTISQALFSWIPPPAADIQPRARETESERGRAGAGAKRRTPCQLGSAPRSLLMLCLEVTFRCNEPRVSQRNRLELARCSATYRRHRLPVPGLAGAELPRSRPFAFLLPFFFFFPFLKLLLFLGNVGHLLKLHSLPIAPSC